jgi:hypothetical protein
VGDPQRRQRLVDRGLDDALREPVQRVRRAVGGLLAVTREPIEERGPARSDDGRSARAGQQAAESQPGNGGAGSLERSARERRDDVQTPRAERPLERREDGGVVDRRRVEPTTSA